MSQNTETLVEDIVSFGGGLIGDFFSAPSKEYKWPKDEEEIPDAGSELRALKTQLDLGQITSEQFEQSRGILLQKYSWKLGAYVDQMKNLIDYCSSCDAPLPTGPFGNCDYCQAPFDRSEWIALAKAIEATNAS